MGEVKTLKQKTFTNYVINELVKVESEELMRKVTQILKEYKPQSIRTKLIPYYEGITLFYYAILNLLSN